ncbi:MAG TPA: pilus assembly protein [Anaerolineales bacterium]|nr:pilus assembly protein [Anaerolineales bacterium]
MTPKYLKSKSLSASEKEKGQSLLEMAFAAIVLLLLISGIVDLGRLFFTYIALREAAQEGAAFASVCPPDAVNHPENGPKIRDHVKTSSQFPVDLALPNIQVIANFTSSPTPGAGLFVQVVYQNFHFITPILNLVDGNISAIAYDISLQFECPD